MKKKSLLASVALFGQLYNSEKYKDIVSIIGDFIKGAVILNKKFALTSYEIKILLEETYDFHLLESVIRTVLHATLKNEFEYEKGVFCFKETISTGFENIIQELEQKDKINDVIFESLKSYVIEKESKALSFEDESELFENFNQFLFDNGSSERYTNHISAYIVRNESDDVFINNLNEIREGLILYQGIRYTADLKDLGKWKNELVIYLNTEYLFNALGYNGILFKDIFFDFYKLVEEINSQDKGKLIHLKYLPETQEEIDSYFYSAESILLKKQRLRPWKVAMKTIVESCKEPSDIVAKKVNFYSELEKLGIEFQEFDLDIKEYGEFNIEDQGVVEELKEFSKSNKREFDEDTCYQFFRIFTKVNYFRKGKNNKPFEKIGHIFITDSSFGKYLGHNNNVKFENSDASFAKDIDYVTTRFWIKLKKGFSEKTDFPKSFNVLTKARIILSSQINASLSKEYNKLMTETKSGKLSDEEALERSYALRKKPNLPMDITADNIDSTFDFLNNEDYLQAIYQEKIRKDELIKKTQQRNVELENELARRDQLDKEREEKERKEQEAKEFGEKKKIYEAEIKLFKQNMLTQISIEWKKELKKTKWHFWNYLIFIVIAIAIMFFLIVMRDSIMTSLNIIVTEKVKLYYSGIVAVIGFIATAIRSFFDTKNILFALKIIFSKKVKNTFKDKKLKEFESDFRTNNKEPQMI